MPDVVVPPDIWGALVGGEPENTMHVRPAGVRQDTGPFLDGVATLAVQPGRVDWLFNPIDTTEPGLATFGDYPAAAEQYFTAISRWIQSAIFPATRRLALGIVLMEPTQTRDTGYERLRNFIDSVPRGLASDFLYQVNRYRPSRTDVPGLTVNRLAKWSVSHVQLFVMSAGMPAPALAAPVFFLNLDLDVNTSADFAGPIPAGTLTALLDDLRLGVNEVATRGDRVGETA